MTSSIGMSPTYLIGIRGHFQVASDGVSRLLERWCCTPVLCC
jgi:hypothetical protein